jgi:hypothetical protein
MRKAANCLSAICPLIYVAWEHAALTSTLSERNIKKDEESISCIFGGGGPLSLECNNGESGGSKGDILGHNYSLDDQCTGMNILVEISPSQSNHNLFEKKKSNHYC